MKTIRTVDSQSGSSRAARPHPFGDPSWWSGLLKEAFGAGFWGFLGFAILAGAACYVLIGGAAFRTAIDRDLTLLASVLPRLLMALSVAGLVWALLPRERFIRLIGRESGLRGLFIAGLAGLATPGGPSSAFSLLAVIGGAGADRGALVAYIVGWSTLGIQRIIVWDVPFMGTEVALVRFLACLPLPVLAGLIARRLPFSLTLTGTGSHAGR